MKRVRLIAVTSLVVLGSCYSRPSTEGQPCERARDCDDAQVCAAGRCLRTTPEAETDGETDDGETGTGG